MRNYSHSSSNSLIAFLPHALLPLTSFSLLVQLAGGSPGGLASDSKTPISLSLSLSLSLSRLPHSPSHPSLTLSLPFFAGRRPGQRRPGAASAGAVHAQVEGGRNVFTVLCVGLLDIDYGFQNLTQTRFIRERMWI